jgi:thymidylate synthase
MNEVNESGYNEASKFGPSKNNPPYISDDFQIGPDGAYEHIEQYKVMNKLDRAYQDLLQDILENGTTKNDRTGTGTISVFGRQIRHKMSDGFPLLTTKKMSWKSIVTELLWFLRGDTNIKYLVDNGCHIWDGDAYKNYCEKINLPPTRTLPLGTKVIPILYTQEEFINKIKTDQMFAFEWGELGPIYGAQWRRWFPGGKDQIANLINDLKTNPDSRRLMVNAWNVGELDQMVLPPCHFSFQVYTRELSLEERIQQIPFSEKHTIHERNECIDDLRTLKGDELKSFEQYIKQQCDSIHIPTRAISLMWNQRSVDSALGWPFNVASYGLLLELFGKMVNMVPDELICNLGDVHLYADHIEGAKEQISRIPYELPKLNINTEFWPTESGECGVGPIDALAVLRSFSDDNFCKCLIEEDIQLYNYQSHPKIYYPLSN